MEKISLNTSPSSILSATIGDVFELDGNLFSFAGNGLIYLTLLDNSEGHWYKEGDNMYTWAHVRNKAGYALMTRQEMCDILESENYFIE